MKRNQLTALLLGLLWIVPTFGQQATNATVEQAEATVKTVRVIELDGVELESSEEPVGKVPVVVVKTDAPNPLVRAYEKTNPFPPKPLLKVGDGRYVLDGKPGTQWTIEVISIVDGAIWSKFLQATIGDLPGDDQDPVGPGPDYSAITKLVKESSQVRDDPTTAKLLYDTYESIVNGEFESLDEIKKAASDARGDALEQVDVSADWNALFIKTTIELLKNEPKTIAEYKAFLRAFVEGLK